MKFISKYQSATALLVFLSLFLSFCTENDTIVPEKDNGNKSKTVEDSEEVLSPKTTSSTEFSCGGVDFNDYVELALPDELLANEKYNGEKYCFLDTIELGSESFTMLYQVDTAGKVIYLGIESDVESHYSDFVAVWDQNIYSYFDDNPNISLTVSGCMEACGGGFWGAICKGACVAEAMAPYVALLLILL